MHTVKQYMNLICLLAIFFVGCTKNDLLPANNETVISQIGHTRLNAETNLVGLITDIETSRPLAGVVVSDGYSVTLTDTNGVYQLKKNNNAVFIFYSIPAEYAISTGDNVTKFYEKIDKSKSIDRHDFKLTRMKTGKETNFTLFCIADPQVKNYSNLTRYAEESAPDIQNEVKKYHTAYAVVLGDLVGDMPLLMPTIKSKMAISGLPVFTVIGNHDHLESANKDIDAVKNYETNFGPTNYSFNRGDAHIVVMDDIIYSGNGEYTGGLTEDQINWLKQDLSFVSKDKILIICIHIPSRNNSSFTNCQKFYSMIGSYAEVHIMSGHTHYNQNMNISGHKVYEHIHGAICGAWWSCNINTDGTPNGYGVYQIEGNHISNWYYKSTQNGMPYQIRMYPPGLFQDASGDIVANIWNADENWKVELIENGIKTGDMIRFTDYDKGVYKFFSNVLNKALPTATNGTATWYKKTDHLYKLTPKSFVSKISIRATDPFGNIYEQDQFTSDLSNM